MPHAPDLLLDKAISQLEDLQEAVDRDDVVETMDLAFRAGGTTGQAIELGTILIEACE